MRLKYQLFLTLLLASAVLIALMYGISRYSFSRSFLDYVNQNAIDRLSPLVEQLETDYKETGDWSLSKPLFRPPPPGRKNENRRRGLQPVLVLLDADKNVIHGRRKAAGTMQTIPLQSDEALVGYLGVYRINRIDREFDQVFENRQQKTFGLTALAMILLSGLLSIPLASRIVRPLLTVNNAVGEISGGNYDHRVDVNRNDEIGDLANKINTLAGSLEKNLSSRQRWIAEISHELRTPVAVLRGEIEAIQDGVRVLDNQAIGSLHSEVLRLNRLIDDLHTLSLSDVGALDYKKTKLNLAQFVDGFLQSHTGALEEKSIRLVKDGSFLNAPDSDFLVLADEHRLDQLFSNLLQNTCRYTDMGGELNVQIGLSGSSGTQSIIVDWFDSSPGVANDELDQLFDPLFRAESSRNRNNGGSGLGLSIVKRIVEAHDGMVTASNSSLGGLHVSISFPIAVGNV